MPPLSLQNMFIPNQLKLNCTELYNTYILILDDESCNITQKMTQSERELTISLKEISVNFNSSMTDDVKTMTN